MRPICCRPLALDLEIFRGGLVFVRDLLVLNNLTLIQTRQTGDGAPAASAPALIGRVV
jgi:hypothetical protein